MGESSEDYSDVEGDFDDGQERSNHSSNSAYGHEDDISGNSWQSDKEDGRQESDDLWFLHWYHTVWSLKLLPIYYTVNINE